MCNKNLYNVIDRVCSKIGIDNKVQTNFTYIESGVY